MPKFPFYTEDIQSQQGMTQDENQMADAMRGKERAQGSRGALRNISNRAPTEAGKPQPLQQRPTAVLQPRAPELQPMEVDGGEVGAGFFSARATKDIDAGDERDPQACTEYVEDIFNYIREVELRNAVDPSYMSRQTDVNERMRAILHDWLTEVHLKFQLLPDTLYLTIAIIDRYLACRTVTRQKLQLVGVTAMLIASKVEEIFAPEVRDFVHISDNTYSREDILEMEREILFAINYNVNIVTPNHFAQRFVKAAEGSRRLQFLVQYLLNMALTDYGMLRFRPSELAAAAVGLGNRVLQNEAWTPTLSRYTQYEESDLTECATHLARLLHASSNTRTSTLRAARHKFASQRFGEVARIPFDQNTLEF